MKVYQSKADRRFYEKQADVPKGVKWAAVEFPFSASPKADFIAWLNQLDYGPLVAAQIGSQQATSVGVNIDEPLFNVIPTPNPVQPDPHFSKQVIAFEDGFEAMPLATKLHYATLALEEAREKIA
jgi:hypothetical protein